jgi:excisionase family DNA binding protein
MRKARKKYKPIQERRKMAHAEAVRTIEKLYLVNEAAELVRVSPWTIWAKLKNGELLRTKVGGRTVIRESELRKLIVDQPIEARA